MKIRLAATVISSAILLASCGGTKTVVVEQTLPPTTAAPVTTAPAVGPDAYLNAILTNYPSIINKFGKKWVVDFGAIACDAITEGMSLSDLVTMVAEGNIDAEMVGYMVGAAIRTICPENQWFIDAATA